MNKLIDKINKIKNRVLINNYSDLGGEYKLFVEAVLYSHLKGYPDVETPM